MTSPGLGYVLRMFPQTSETFIANEVLELERLGVPIRIYSYRRPKDAVYHGFLRLIRAKIAYLPDPLYRHVWGLVRAQRAIRGIDPVRYRRTLRYVLVRSLRSVKPDVWRRFLQASYLAYLMRDGGVDHLHAHFAHRSTQVAMLAGMLTGLPFSFSAHAKDIYAADPADLREKVQAAQFVVTCTRANQKYLQEIVAADQRDKIHLCYHGVDISKFRPFEGRIIRDRHLILAVGRLVEKKGFRHLLNACKILRDKGHDFRCLIIGEGPDRRSLQKMVRTLALQDVVVFEGSRSQEEVLDSYRRATVFALPCQVVKDGDRDGIPNVLFEAMATGLPVVSTPVSGIPELIENGRNGLLVAERDPEALASAIELLLQDGALREGLGRNARFTVATEFDSKIHARRLAELLWPETMSRRPGAPAARAV